jgi:hypothetical protein
MASPSTFQRYLGKTFVGRYDEPVLQIGPVALSRYALAHDLDCAATAKAAGILSTALRQLHVKTTKDALAVNPIDLASIPGVGVTAVYVFLCWQRLQRGSPKGVADWYGEAVTVSTLKTRVAKRKARERPAKVNRARGRLRLVG